MDKRQAQKLIKETFEQPYEEAQYKYFVKELFNDLDDKSENFAFIYSDARLFDAQSRQDDTIGRKTVTVD